MPIQDDIAASARSEANAGAEYAVRHLEERAHPLILNASYEPPKPRQPSWAQSPFRVMAEKLRTWISPPPGKLSAEDVDKLIAEAVRGRDLLAPVSLQDDPAGTPEPAADSSSAFAHVPPSDGNPESIPPQAEI